MGDVVRQKLEASRENTEIDSPNDVELPEHGNSLVLERERLPGLPSGGLDDGVVVDGVGVLLGLAGQDRQREDDGSRHDGNQDAEHSVS